MTDKNERYKANIARAITSGISYDLASSSGGELENIAFSNPLYESSMLRNFSGEEGTIIQPYFRFKGYSRLSDKQKCIEEVIRQAEIYHEDSAGIQVIKWIQEQNSNIRFRYLSSAGLLFGMKYSQLDIYPYNAKKHEDIITSFFEKALLANVPPLDVIRYWRKISNTSNSFFSNENIPPILIHPENYNVSIGKSLCDSLEPLINKEKNPIKDVNVSSKEIVLYNSKLEQIKIEDENGKLILLTIQLYPNDTLETLKIRFAIENDIPLEMVTMKIWEDDIIESESKIDGVEIQYISVKDWKYNYLENKKIIVDSIIDIIEENPIDLKSTETIIKSITTFSEIMEQKLNINKDDGFYIYLIVRYSLFDGYPLLDEQGKEINLDDIVKNIDENIEYIELLLAKKIDIIKFKIVIQNYVLSLKQTINIGKKYTGNTNVLETCYKIQTYFQKNNNIKSSDIHETNFTINGTFSLEGVDIYELFNSIVCSHVLPFMNLHHFYKCLNDIKVPNDWCKEEFEEQDTLRFYINNLDIQTMIDDNYSLCTIKQIDTKEGINSFKYKIYGTSNIPINTLLSKFIQILSFKPENITVKKDFGKGTFILSEVPFYEDLFYDYCSNNDAVSEIISIDEKYKIHKIRGGLKFSMNLNKQDTENTLKCIMKQKNIEKSTEVEVKYFPHFVKVGSTVTVLQISGSINTKLLNYYKNMLQIIFNYIHSTYYHNYVNYYCSRVQNIMSFIKQPVKKDLNKDLNLKDIAPDLFLSGYVRSCSYPPTIITSEEEKEKFIQEGKDIMTYPKINDQFTSFSYVCNKDKKKIYPGLRINEMENSEIYPAVPCCYQDNQNIEGTIRYKYEHDIPLISETTGMGTFITTRKILKATQEGSLPPAIKNLLTMTDNDTLLGTSSFIRMAVPKGNWSILDALKLSTNSKLSMEQIINKCKDLSNMNLLSQSNLTIEEAIQILNTKSYIAIKDWITILQHIFEVNIVIFISNKDDLEGQLSYQNYKRYLIINPNINYQNAVLIFNTYGGEFDRLEYPHNEYIVKRTIIGKKKEYISMFPSNGETYKSIAHITKNLINYQIISNELPISKQFEDGYGKIRKIITNGLECYTSPIAPSIIPVKNNISTTSTSTNVVNNKIIQKFLNTYNIQNVQQIIHNNKCIAIIGDYITSSNSITSETNNNSFQIIIKIDQKNMQDFEHLDKYNIQKYGYPIPPSDTISFLQLYNRYNRLANYIISYTCYLYSILKHENNIDLNTFEKNHIIIIPNHNYGTIQRLLDLNKNGIIKNNKCVLPSEDIKIRTLFYIQMLENYNPLIITNYKYNKYIPSYYNNSEDFTKSTHYTIYNTLEEFLETRRLKKAQYALYDKLFKSMISYFYSNIEISKGKVYLVIPANSLEQAYSRCIYFNNTNKILLYPPYMDGEYNVLIQDNNGIQTISKINNDNKSALVGRLIITKSREENHWFSMIPLK